MSVDLGLLALNTAVSRLKDFRVNTRPNELWGNQLLSGWVGEFVKWESFHDEGRIW